MAYGGGDEYDQYDNQYDWLKDQPGFDPFAAAGQEAPPDPNAQGGMFQPDQPNPSPFDPAPYSPPPPSAEPQFMPGGSPSVPPTAIPTPAPIISPTTFQTPEEQRRITPLPPAPAATTTTSQGIQPYTPTTGALQLVGFNPGAHIGETPNVTTPKYAVANVLQQMSTQPGFDPLNFAAAAAAQLNAMFNTNQFIAADGQTIIYGDEYVHTAPPGYHGTDPHGGWELFWGSTGPSVTPGAAGPGAGTPTRIDGPGGSTGTGGTGGGSGGGLFNGIDIAGLIQGLLKPPTSGAAALPGGYSAPGGPLLPDLNQVGDDPFSRLITSGLGGMIEGGGSTPRTNAVFDALKTIINGGGRTAATDQTPALIAARDNEAMAEKGMLADMRRELANRGLVSEPGVAQGPEVLGIQRTAETLAPIFAAKVAEITQHGLDLENSNLMTSLSLATGLSQTEAGNMLTALSTGSSRQVALANIALQTLEQNRQWQQFLAQYGLDRDRIAAEIQHGNMQDVIGLINAFLTSVTTSTGGYI